MKFWILLGGFCVLCVVFLLLHVMVFLGTLEEDGFAGDSLLDAGRTYWCFY